MSASLRTALPDTSPATGIPCIGLTGGIGSGKSTVARLFEKLGACIVDTDAISHQLTEPGGEAIPEIRAAFDDDFITTVGALDRDRMRQRVFSDTDAKARLQQILHPRILAASQARLTQCGPAPYVILMVPLLLESPAFMDLVQRVLVVDCAEQQQVARVMLRSKLDEKAVRAIIAQQISRNDRLKQADDVIHNEGTLDELELHISELHRLYASLRNQISI